VSVVELCRRFKISRVTACKWLNRFRAGRLESLKDKSRRPRHLAHRTEPLWLKRIVRVDPLTVRDLHGRYGLRVVLLRGQTVKQTQGEFVKIFKQYGLPRRIRSDSPFFPPHEQCAEAPLRFGLLAHQKFNAVHR
jgi:hypothetical protein